MRNRKPVKGKKIWSVKKENAVDLLAKYARFYNGEYIIYYNSKTLSAETPMQLRLKLEKEMSS